MNYMACAVLCTLFLLPFVTPVQSQTAVRKNLLDYYHQVVDEYLPGYQIKRSGEMWTTTSVAEGDIRVLVDLESGYLEFGDPGTGGGYTLVQVALFRMADRSPVLAIAQTVFDDFYAMQTCAFLRPEDPDRLDWTETTLPRIDAFSFIDEGDTDLPRDLVIHAIPVLITLPQQGTNITVSAWTGMQSYYCSDYATEEHAKLCPVFNHITDPSFEMHWNREKGKFE